jgi:nucleoside-diphosphate-sugar epimerase
LADAFAALLFSEAQGVFNVGSGVGTAVGKIAQILGELVGRPDLIHLGELPTKATDPPVVVADATRLMNELGWRTKVDLWKGLAQTVSHCMMRRRQSQCLGKMARRAVSVLSDKHEG